jgi:hypothetical protein
MKQNKTQQKMFWRSRMKQRMFVHKYLPCWLAVFVLLSGLLLPVRPAQALGPCTPVFVHYGLITSDETWCSSGTHYLSDDVTIQAGVTLTIGPGTTVDSFTGAFWKYLIIQGHLDILGTQAQPVLLTGTNIGNGSPWGGLFFDGSAGDGSGTINYASIEIAGANLGGYGGAQHAVLVKDLAAGKQVTISHSTIRNNVSKGLYVVNSTVSVTNTTFSQNHYPIVIEGAASIVTYSGNTFVDNSYGYPNLNYPMPLDAILIGPGALMGQNFSLPVQNGLDAYIFPSGTTVPAGRTVTLQPGVVLRTGDGSLVVKGHLDAVGTQALPILFTGIPHNDDLSLIYEWPGLIFDGRDGDGTGHLAYVTLEKAADNLTEYGPYELLVRNTPAAGQVLLEHCTLQDGRGFAARVVNGSLAVSSTTIQRVKWPLQIEGAAAQVPLTNNIFSNNTHNYVYILPGAMTDHNINLTLQTGLNAYYFTDTYTVPNGKTLTLQPGVVVRNDNSKFLIIQGDLQAVGSAAQPVKFTDSDEANGLWGGLIFDGPNGASGHLDHAIVERGCQWWYSNGCATLMIFNLAANKSVIVEHSILQTSADMVLEVLNSPTAQVDNNLIRGGRIGVYLASNNTLKNLAIIDQVLDGVIVETGYTVDARHLTIARAGRAGFAVHTGATGSLKNSILSHNVLAVSVDGTGQASLDTNLADANTTFKSGTVSELHTLNASAEFESDGYHIKNGSSAEGKGLAGLAALDIDGDVRPLPQSSKPDLGADEINSTRYMLYLPVLIRK